MLTTLQILTPPPSLSTPTNRSPKVASGPPISSSIFLRPRSSPVSFANAVSIPLRSSDALRGKRVEHGEEERGGETVDQSWK